MTKESNEMRWYTIRTQNNKERSVLEKMITELKYSNIESKVGRSIIPTEKVISIRNGKRVFREKVVYPGYIFVETNATGELMNLLKGINGASGFVRTRSGEIHPMKEDEVRKILVEQEVADTKDMDSEFSLGEDVKIIEGSFTTFKGKISSLDKERKKIKVEVSIFGRQSLVDLTFSQIEKI